MNSNQNNVVLSLIIICLLLQSGCQTLVEQPKLDAEVPSYWRNLKQSNNLTTNNLSSPWWLSLNDPNLNEILDLALNNNLSIAQANERLIAVKTMEDAKHTKNSLPLVDFSAGPDNLARSQNSDSDGTSSLRTKGAYIAGFDLLWEIPIFGRADAQGKVAEANVKLAKTDINSVRLSLITEVTGAYADLRASQAQVKQYDEIINKYQLLASLAKKGENAGLIDNSEHEKLETNLNDIQNLKLEVVTISEFALQKLATLCGKSKPADKWSSFANQSWEFTHTEALPSTLPANLIKERPDVQMAEAEVLLAAGQLGIAKSDLYPRLSIEGALMLAGNLLSANSTQTISVLAPSVRLPIIDWGLGRQVVNSREAKLRESILGYRQSVLLAIENVENSLANFNTSEMRLIRDEKLTDKQIENSKNMQNAYEAGYLSLPQLIDFQIKVLKQRQKLIEAKSSWLINLSKVHKAFSTSSNTLLSN